MPMYGWPGNEQVDDAYLSHVPVGLLFPEVAWPEDQFEGAAGLLDRLIATGWSGSPGRFEIDLFAETEQRLSLPGVDGLELVLGGPEGADDPGIPFRLAVTYDQDDLDAAATSWVLTLSGLAVTFVWDTDLLRDMESDGAGGYVETGEAVALTFTGEVRVNHDWTVEFDSVAGVDLGSVQIGSTGVIVSASDVVPYFGVGALPDGAADLGLDDAFRGLLVGEAQVILPRSWGGRAAEAYATPPPPLVVETDLDGRTVAREDGTVSYLPPETPVYVGPRITFSSCAIGTGGFSGDIAFDVDAETDLGEDPLPGLVPTVPAEDRLTDAPAGVSGLSAELFGFGLALQRFELSLRHNTVTSSTIDGSLRVPFLDAWFDVEVTVAGDGALDVGLSMESGAPLVDLTIESVLELSIDSLRLSDPGAGEPAALVVEGALTPLLDIGSAWPTIAVQDLAIFTDGTVALAGGWLKLPTQFAVDFFGFQLELATIGFGTGDLLAGDGGVLGVPAAGGWRWIGLSGTLRLVDELGLAGSVEGLKIAWRPLPEGGFEWDWSLAGIGIEAATDAFSFNGSVRFIDQPDGGSGFAGAVALSLTSLGLAFEAEFVVGRTEAAPAGHTYWGVALGVELPAGIPLGPTGVAVYGLRGLGSQNLTPDITPLEEWYGGWYKRKDLSGRDGVTLGKHRPRKGALGFGLGVTLGSAPDNGFTVNMKALALLLFPGPTILVAGKASFLSPRAALDGPGEPPFESLLLIDGGDGSVLLNVSADFPVIDERVLSIAAHAEAWFSAQDPAAWYLDIGRRPLEERISVTALSLFEALGYLQIDQGGIRTGFRVGFGDTYRFGRLSLAFDIHIDSSGALSFAPVSVVGTAELGGSIRACAYGICLGISASAGMRVRAFTPLSVTANLSVEVDLPCPLPSLSADVTLEWHNEEPPDYVDPFVSLTLAHPWTAEEWSPSATEVDAPAVPMDSRPVVTFSCPVADPMVIGQPAAYLTEPAPQVVGDREVRYALTGLTLERRTADGGFVPVDDVSAVWLLTDAPAALDPEQAEAGGARNTTKLEVWGRTPFSYEDHTTTRTLSQYVVADPFFPCGPPVDLTDICVDWTGVPERTRYPFVSTHESLRGVANRFLEVAAEPAFGPGGDADRCLALPPGAILVLALPGPAARASAAVESLGECTVQAWGRPEGMLRMLGTQTVSGRGGRPVEFEAEGIEWLVLAAESRTDCSPWTWQSPVVARASAPGSGGPADGPSPGPVAGDRVPDDPAAPRPITAVPCCTLLYRVCWLEEATIEAADRLIERRESFSDWTQSWAGSAQVFGPNTTYRLTAEVVATGIGDPAVFTRTRYFRTQGPPGFLAEDPDGKGALLATLAPYVTRTSPPPGAGTSVADPAHYRDHDVVVLHSTDTVKEMYSGQLFLEVIDANGRPVTGADGRTRFEADFADPTHRALTTGETTFVEAIDGAACSSITWADVGPSDSQGFELPTLAPQTLYQARVLGGWSPSTVPADDGEVVPDPGDLEFREVYRWEFVTSRYTDVTAHVGSYDPEHNPWDGREALDGGDGGLDAAAVAALLYGLPSGGGSWDEDEKSVADQVLGLVGARPRPPPDRVEVTVARDRPRAVGLLIDSPEPWDWSRIGLTVTNGAGVAIPHVLVRARDGRRALLFRRTDGLTLASLAAPELLVTVAQDLAVAPSRYSGGTSGTESATMSVRIAPKVPAR